MIRRLLLFAAWGLGLPACIAAPPSFAAPSNDRVVIFVPGYRGSFLREEAGARALIWLTPAGGLSTGDTSLALDFVGRREDKRHGPLTADGPMTRITAVPLLYAVDAYLPWMNAAKEAGLDFVPFGYDWRRDIREPSARLCETIAALARPRRKVSLVGHSMGGLVTLHCLRTASAVVRQTVERVVFVGVPFRGGPGILDDLTLGTASGRNTALMSAPALFTFASSWQLLPLGGDFFEGPGQLRPQIDLQDPGTWTGRGWSVFSDRTLAVEPRYLAQLSALLKARADLWSILGDAPDAPFPWKAMAVIGKGRPTPVAWPVDSSGNVDLHHPITGDGDGTVATARSKPPSPIAFVEVETDVEHSQMLNAPGVQQVVIDFLRRP